MFITAGNFTLWYYVYIDAFRLTIGASSSCATYFMGNVTISGTRTMSATSTTATFKVLNYTTSLNNTSDSRLKQNIANINDGSLELIEQLRPVTYQWNDLHNRLFNSNVDASGNDLSVPDTDTYPGFIAQEVETVLPLAVGSMDVSGSTYKTIRPIALIPYLVKAIQELSAQVKALQSA